MSSFPTTPVAKLTGHAGIVHCVSYSAGSQSYILTGSSDRTIRLYNPSKAPLTSSVSGAGLVTKYTAHGYEVLSLAVADANDKFVSVGGDKTVFYWDVQTAQTIKRWTGHAGRINCCAFGGEGDSVVVSGSFDGTVRVWDTKSTNYKPIMTLDEAKDSVSDVWVRDGEIVSGSVDGRIRSYDLRMGMCSVDVVGYPVTSLAVSKKGSECLVSSLDSTIRLMDRENGQLLKAYRDEGYLNKELRVKSTLGFNDSVVVSGSDNGMVYVWDLLEGEVLHKFRHSEMREMMGKEVADSTNSKKDVVGAVTVCRSRREWVSAGGDGNVIVWGEGA